jgi:group I intron endonuclease
MNIGIYKITNPKGKNYIGSTVDLKRREKEYEKLKCKNQILIYNSLKKYGWENHTFEIIEKCDIELLNEREIYWTEYYKAFSEDGGLVLQVGGNNGYQSSDTKDRKSKSMKGKLLGRSNIGVKNSWVDSNRIGGNTGHSLSSESKNKISISKQNHPMYTNEWRDKISTSLKGRKITWGDKISKSNVGVSRNKGKNQKPVLQFTLDGILINTFNSISEASQNTNINFNIISNNLLGYSKTGKNYVWKYK